MAKKPWAAFASVTSHSFVKGLVPGAAHVPPEDLVSMRDYRGKERISACNGTDPLRVLLAYAQDELAYDEKGRVYTPEVATYRQLPREKRLNKFGLAYRRDAEFWLHRTLADIIIGAAIHLFQTQGWTTVLYDGLRTVEGAFNLYQFAAESDITNRLLALPGESAHNKGMAVDSMMEKDGKEIDMGGHFDHLDMTTNSRLYDGPLISENARRNRLIREAAFLRSAFTQGLLIAPLRNEFWDDRLPENRVDLWRVLDSAARCIGISLLTSEDDQLRRTRRDAFRNKWEHWSYDDFLSNWKKVFNGKETLVKDIFGVSQPPGQERPEFYHGNFHPIYDSRLQASGKHLTAGLIAA